MGVITITKNSAKVRYGAHFNEMGAIGQWSKENEQMLESFSLQIALPRVNRHAIWVRADSLELRACDAGCGAPDVS